VVDQFEPDVLAYSLVREVYAAFGYGADAIPFWDVEHQRFAFPAG